MPPPFALSPRLPLESQPFSLSAFGAPSIFFVPLVLGAVGLGVIALCCCLRSKYKMPSQRRARTGSSGEHYGDGLGPIELASATRTTKDDSAWELNDAAKAAQAASKV